MLGIIFCIAFMILGFCHPNITNETRNWFFLVSAFFYMGAALRLNKFNNNNININKKSQED